MDHWWTTEEVRAQPELFRLMVATQTRIYDMDDDVTDSIMRLATEGKIELGDRNGAMLLRESKGCKRVTCALTNRVLRLIDDEQSPASARALRSSPAGKR